LLRLTWSSVVVNWIVLEIVCVGWSRLKVIVAVLRCNLIKVVCWEGGCGVVVVGSASSAATPSSVTAASI